MSIATVNDAAKILGRDHENRFNRRMPQQNSSAPDVVREPVFSSAMPRLVIIFAGFSLLSAIAIYLLAEILGNEIAKGGHSDSTALHEIVIGNDVLHVPANLIRFASQRRSRDLEKLDLYMHWPTLSGYQAENAEIFNSSDHQQSIVFLGIEPRSMSIDMAGRIDPIYRKFFDGPALKSRFGLTRQPLLSSSGFIDEDLYIEAGSPYPFVARCLRTDSLAGIPYCIRDIHIGNDLMLTYRFHASLLAQWMNLERDVRSKMKQLLAK